MAYDANGNLDYVNSAAESNYTFDAENRVKTRTYGAATTSYVYDGSGAMVKRTTAGAGGQSETTVYIGGLYEKNVTTGVVTKYYSALGRTIAMRKSGPAGTVLSYLLADHLGGTAAVLDASGNVTASRKYWPYGAERAMSGDQRATDKWYTGQRDEDYDGLGLYNYKARMYSTTLGRFVSADPLTVDGLNRYTYVRNNPLRYTDPSGLCHAGGPGCPSPAPTPSSSATPTPGGYELNVCAMHPLGCLLLGAGAFGSSDLGLVIVLGMHQTASGSIDQFSNYVLEFLSKTSNCKTKVAECYAGFIGFLKYAGADAAYDIFGVKVITTDAGGMYIGGVAGSIRGRTPGGEVLADFMRAPGKDLIGVIGFSLGANTVAA